MASHARFTEPPSRATAWRYGFDTPHNYNDNEGFCGGFTYQFEQADGKCGICGGFGAVTTEDYIPQMPVSQAPREHRERIPDCHPPANLV